MHRKNFRVIILGISVLTIVAGTIQLIDPGLVLSMIEGEASPTTFQLFATIGLFMIVFGALMLHSLCSAYTQPVAVLWCGLQKAGAAIAVLIGIARGLFASSGILVAGFDLVSALIIFMYLANEQKAYRATAD